MSGLKFDNTPKVGKAVRKAAVVLFSLLLFASAILLLQWTAWGTAQPRPSLASPLSLQEPVTPTLRVYGGPGWPDLPGNRGAGSDVITDPVTALLAEDQPYTDTVAIFNPQLPQAPRKDSITWNPIFMSESETEDENQREGLYQKLVASDINASEKVWFRMWYEPEHWDKDLDADGEFDRDPSTGEPTGVDEWYPAIMQEFTYLLMELDYAANEPGPTYGQAGRTSFVFPVGMRATDLFTDTWVVDTESDNALYGYGLTSLDGNFDDVPDIVHVESEQTLQTRTGIAADFDGDGVIEPLDVDGIPLNGNELAVFRLGILEVPLHGCVQFLDHLACVEGVFNNGASVRIWYTGDRVPTNLGSPVVNLRGMVLAGSGSTRVIPAGGTNIGLPWPTGPFFAYLENADPGSGVARLMVGRALGATWSAMEDIGGGKDNNPSDPWFLKRFYVDGHEYNVVAIRTRGYTEFQFITIRTPIPKVPITIEQHSVRLQHYPPLEPLSVMPPYNYEHYIIEDVQASTAGAMGSLLGPVAPILQKNGPFPYTGIYPAWPVGPYDNLREVYLFYVKEAANPQFLGELKEKYGEITATLTITEFWYVEQWWTLPWKYTEFLLPDIQDETDLYLLSSSFISQTGDKVKFWFDPAEGGKKYKDPEGVRLYGDGNEGAGDTSVVTDTVVTQVATLTAVVEVPPYTAPWDPFNPQLPQAPRKDSLTFNPAYMDRFHHGGESLRDLYARIFTEVGDAREKVFFRMWYEPEYLDKVRDTESYIFPALMQEFTYMFLDTLDRPSHGQPGSSQFAFPIGTAADELPAPDPATGDLSFTSFTDPARFGYGLTTFDADFNGSHDIVVVHSEQSLSQTTSIQADFDGDGVIDQLDTDGVELSGDELVVFAVEDIVLELNESAMFLDHMVTLDNISWAPGWPSTADLKFWFTGGGIYAIPGGYSIHPPEPPEIRTLYEGDMAVARGISPVHVISAGGNNLGRTDGAWFAYLKSVNVFSETAVLTIGRALGATHSAIDDGMGHHDMTPGDPWYLKRFFVDGHEYNVVAIKTVPADSPGEDFEFKYITIRTPVPKVNFINNQDSIKLEGYYQGILFDVVDTDIISVMPPFNFRHTRANDIQALKERDVPPGETEEELVFANPDFYDENCCGEIITEVTGEPLRDLYSQAFSEVEDAQEEGTFANSDLCAEDCPGELTTNVEGGVPPLEIRVVDEDIEPQFTGELKEILSDGSWSSESFHTMPDEFTELSLLPGQLYLLTSSWESDQSRVHYYGCDPTNGYFTQDDLHGFNPNIPASNTALIGLDPFFAATVTSTLRVKFWYDPRDAEDIYINTWVITPTLTATATSNSPVCEGETIELYGGPDGMDSYNWTGPGGFNSTEQNPTRLNATLAMSGTYSLTVTKGSETSGPATTDVIVNEKPTATASSNSPVCEWGTIELYGGPSGMASYHWTGPDGFDSLEQNPTRLAATLAMSGTYTLTVTDSNGCTDAATTDVVVNEKPTATASSNSPVFEGETIQLYGGPNGMDSYNWMGPGGFGSTDQNPTRPSATLAMSGTYTLTVTLEGCPSDPVTTDVVVIAEGGPQGWLDPQHSSASYCITTEVEIWVDADGFKSGQIKLAYDSACADVEGWAPNTTDFPLAQWDSDTPGEEWITFSALEPITGTYQVGTLTIHCVSEEECTTALDFVEDGPSTTKLFNDWGSEIPGTWEDGTFECTLGLCGDVAPYPNCDGVIDMGDVSLLHSYVGHPGEYSLCCEWCGDVAPYPNCNGTIDMGDVSLLHSYVGHPGDYHLCCEGGTFAIPASVAPAVAENEVNLVPQDSSALFGETAEVEMWVDATAFKAGQIKLAYDSTCADVVDWVANEADFPMVEWDSGTAGEEWITFSAEEPMTGTYRIGTLTVLGVSEEGCITVLDFVEDGLWMSKLFDDWGNEISATWVDGTFQSLGTYTVFIPAAVKDTGYLFSQDLLENHFGSAAMWTGFVPSGADRGKYYGAVQFDLSDIPPEAQILSAEVELTPWPTDYLDSGAGGSWTLNLLGSDVDPGWQGKSYWDIAVLASVEATIGPALSYDDLGGVNTFAFSEEQLGALEERLGTTGKASFRLDYEATHPFFKDIFGWDGGAPPMLRVTYFAEP